MELRQLEYLVAVAEEASFSGAAKRLGVQQPSISEQIRKLERELKQPLLDRLPRHVVPTAAGQRLIDDARRILADVEHARLKARDAVDEPVGRLAIGAIPTVAPFLLPQLVRRFERTYPKIELVVTEDTTGRLIEDVIRGQLDVALASTTPLVRHLQTETAFDEPLVLMLSTTHRLAKRRQVDWPDLADERFVVLHEMNCLSGQAQQVCARRGLHPPVVMHGSNLLTLASMVAIGMGISIVPQMMADSAWGAAPGCVFRPFRGVAPTRPITLLWGLLRYRTLAARAFEEMVRRGSPS